MRHVTHGTREVKAKRVFVCAALAVMAAHTLPLLPVLAKQQPLAIPTYTTLDVGAGPETHDVLPSGTASGVAPESSVPDLSPVKLSSPPAATSIVAPPKPIVPQAKTQAEAEAPAQSEPSLPSASSEASAPTATTAQSTAEPSQSADAPKENVLNATINRDEFVPKAPVDRTDVIVGDPVKTKPSAKDDQLQKEVHDLGMKLGPVPLQESEEESDKKITTVVDAEKSQLADIWDAALCRNQDIQFVVQKLMPTKDPKHTTAIMMKMLSTAMYAGMSISPMLMPGGGTGAMGMYAAQNAGASLVMGVLNNAQSKQAKRAAVTETEAIMLYNIIRNVAEKVVTNFHDYKRNLSSVDRAYKDYQDLQNMVSEARSGQDAAKQIEMEYMLRKARREIDSINDDVRRCRQALVDLSGTDSVDKLDKQIAIENSKVDDATPVIMEAGKGQAEQTQANVAEQPTPPAKTEKKTAGKKSATNM